MASQTDICNEALGLISKPAITDIDEGTLTSLKCKNFWENACDEALRVREWNFATVRVQLAQDFDVPIYGYDYAYTKPADCLRLVCVARDAYDMDRDTAPEISYKLEGDSVLCNEEELFAKYIKRVTETGLYDPLFCSYLAACLAAKLAGSFVLGMKAVQSMLELARYRLSLASPVDRQESGSSQRRINSSWLDAR